MTTPEFTHRHIPPRRRRLRHFVLQLLPITAGILIALLVDSTMELVRQRSLVREARAAIAAEIAANAGDLDDKLAALAAAQDDFAKMTQLVNDILNTGRSDIEGFGHDISFPALHRASWESAEHTGAFEYMDFAEVRRFSSLYAYQDRVDATQRELHARLPGFGIIIEAMASGDPEGYAQDLQQKRTDLAEFNAALVQYMGIANTLAVEYQAFACGNASCAGAPVP